MNDGVDVVREQPIGVRISSGSERSPTVGICWHHGLNHLHLVSFLSCNKIYWVGTYCVLEFSNR
jgi:hypothetical protein